MLRGPAVLENETIPLGANRIPEDDEPVLGVSFGNVEDTVGATTEVGTPPVDATFCEATEVGTTMDVGTSPVDPTFTEAIDVGTTTELAFAEVGAMIEVGRTPVDPTSFDEAIEVGTTIGLADEGVGETITDGMLPVDATVFWSLTTELGAFDGDSVDTGATDVFDDGVGETTTDGADPVDTTLLWLVDVPTLGLEIFEGEDVDGDDVDGETVTVFEIIIVVAVSVSSLLELDLLGLNLELEVEGVSEDELEDLVGCMGFVRSSFGEPVDPACCEAVSLFRLLPCPNNSDNERDENSDA